MKIRQTILIKSLMVIFLFLLVHGFWVNSSLAYFMTFYDVVDTQPPVIIAADPNIFPPQSDVSTSPTIRIEFSKTMNKSATENAFALYSILDLANKISGTCTVVGKVLTFSPDSPLSEDSTYKIVVSVGAQDINGNPLAEGSTSWYFYTMQDYTPPYITDCSPAKDTANVPLTQVITFHVRDSGVGVDPNSVELQINDLPVVVSTTGTGSDLTVSSPTMTFGYDQEVKVSIDAKDKGKNPVSLSYCFTTENQLPPPLDQFWSNDLKNIANITAMAIDSKDQLWVAARKGEDDNSGGVNMFDGTTWHSYTAEGDGLGSDNITALVVNGDDNIWIGLGLDTDMGTDPNTVPKLAKFNGSSWTLYYAKELGMPYDEEINDLAVNSQDNLWIATAGSGVIYFSQGTTVKYDEQTSLETNSVKAIAIDDGTVWAGTTYYGVMKFNAQTESWEQYSCAIHAKDLVDFFINDMTIDTMHNIWLATNSGLLKLSFDGLGQQSWSYYCTENSDLSDDFVNTVTVDKLSGNIWIGTDKGLLKFDGQSTWRDYSTEEDYYAELLSTNPVIGIAINIKGEMWVATDSSLARRDALCPRILSIVPGNGEKNVSKTPTIQVTFSEAMNPLATASFGLYDSKNKSISVKNISTNGNVLSFSSASSLKDGAKYTIKVTPQAEDLLGNNLDIDGDGLGGEPSEDEYSSTFIVKQASSSGGASGGGSTLPVSGLYGISGLYGMGGFSSFSNLGMNYYMPTFNFTAQLQNNFGLFNQFSLINPLSGFNFQFNQFNQFNQFPNFYSNQLWLQNVNTFKLF